MPKLPLPTSDAPAADVVATGELETHKIVDALCARRRDLLAALRDCLELETALLKRGPGKHSGNGEGNVLTVVAATSGSSGTPSYALANDDEARARELAGDDFPKLFDRHVTFTPCKGFEDVAPKLLTPAKARDIVQLCYVPGKPTSGKAAYILWPEPLKTPKKA